MLRPLFQITHLSRSGGGFRKAKTEVSGSLSRFKIDGTLTARLKMLSDGGIPCFYDSISYLSRSYEQSNVWDECVHQKRCENIFIDVYNVRS